MAGTREERTATAPRPAVRRRTGALLALVLVVAAGMRLGVLATPLRALNGDEAVTALMAQRIADGHGYVFFAGQDYMGAAVQYLQAPVLALFPGSPLALRFPDLALSVLAVWLVHDVGRRLLGSPRAALVAAGLYALGPAFNLLYASRSHGAYNAALVAGLVALRYAVARGTRRDALLTGLATGIGVWSTPVSLYLSAPAIAWLVWASRERVQTTRDAAAGIAVGTAPVWLWMVAHAELAGISSWSGPSPVVDRLTGLVGTVGPEFLGLAWRDGAPVLPALLWPLVLVLLVALWLRVVHTRVRAFRGGHRPVPRDLVVAVWPLVVAAYLASSFTWWTTEPRYLYTAYPWLCWALATLAHDRDRRRGNYRATLSALVGVAALTTAAVPVAVDHGPRGSWHGDLRSVARWLDARDVHAAYADYRPAYPLTFLSRGDVTAVPYDDDACRFPDLLETVDRSPRVAYIVSDTYDAELRTTWRADGVRVAESLVLPSVSVYLLEDDSARPWDVGLAEKPPRCSVLLSLPLKDGAGRSTAATSPPQSAVARPSYIAANGFGSPGW